MDVVRPVIKMKMRKYGGGAEGGDIRFNLLALVDDHYQAASDELELLKREKKALERRLDEVDPEGWKGQVCSLCGRFSGVHAYVRYRSMLRYWTQLPNLSRLLFRQKHSVTYSRKASSLVNRRRRW